MTIPVEVRRKLDLRPVSRLAFVASDTGGYEIHPEAAPIRDLTIRDLKGAVPGPAHPVSLEDMDEAAGSRACSGAGSTAR